MDNHTTNNSLHFSHFIGNKEIINKLKLELIRLNGRRYICNDEDLTYIEQEIVKVEKTLKFNVLLSLSSSLV